MCIQPIGQFDSKINCLKPNMRQKTHSSDIKKNVYLFYSKQHGSISSRAAFIHYNARKQIGKHMPIAHKHSFNEHITTWEHGIN